MRKKICIIMFMVMSLTLNACGTSVAPKSSTEISAVDENSELTTANKLSDSSTTDAATETTITDQTLTNNDSEITTAEQTASDTVAESTTDEISTTTDIDSNEITINYPSGYFEDDVDIVLEMDTEKTQTNLKNCSDLYELFGSSLRMGSFLGIEDNGYFLMIIGSGVYYEGTWERPGEEGYIATFKDMNSGEQESITIDTDNDCGQFVTTVYGEKIYWKTK